MANVSVKTAFTGCKVNPEQYQLLKQRAAHSKLPLSAWMRSILMQAANQKPRKGYLRIREPDGDTD